MIAMNTTADGIMYGSFLIALFVGLLSTPKTVFPIVVVASVVLPFALANGAASSKTAILGGYAMIVAISLARNVQLLGKAMERKSVAASNAQLMDRMKEIKKSTGAAETDTAADGDEQSTD